MLKTPQMKTLIISALLISCHSPQHLTTAQVYNLRSGTWQPQGEAYKAPADITTIYGYKWRNGQIIAIQDYKKQNGKWIKFGDPYKAPDTLRHIKSLNSSSFSSFGLALRFYAGFLLHSIAHLKRNYSNKIQQIQDR